MYALESQLRRDEPLDERPHDRHRALGRADVWEGVAMGWGETIEFIEESGPNTSEIRFGELLPSLFSA